MPPIWVLAPELFSSAVSMISPSMSLLPTHIRMAVHTEVTNKRPEVEPRVFGEN